MILLTGATGYIGSHIWIELLKGSTAVVGVDNLSNSKINCLDAIFAISGKKPNFYQGDIRDKKFLDEIFSGYPITHVIHLAALKDVQESMVHKEEYFDVNVRGLENLLAVMRSYGCRNIIFSSSAAVYGESAESPIKESLESKPSNYYGQTKVDGEELLVQEPHPTSSFNSVILRYFNVVGSHASGLLSEAVLPHSRSLFSEIGAVLRGAKSCLLVYGDDWGTKDGTCVRDYLHVSDLTRGHLDALQLLDSAGGSFTLNLGSGSGYSVYEVLSVFEGIFGRVIPRKVVQRRAGDIGVSIADIGSSIKYLNWHPSKTLTEMCSSSF